MELLQIKKWRILHGRAEIRNLSSSVEKNFTIEPSERVKYFSKYFCKIFKNILYYFKNSFLLRKGRFIM